MVFFKQTDLTTLLFHYQIGSYLQLSKIKLFIKMYYYLINKRIIIDIHLYLITVNYSNKLFFLMNTNITAYLQIWSKHWSKWILWCLYEWLECSWWDVGPYPWSLEIISNSKSVHTLHVRSSLHSIFPCIMYWKWSCDLYISQVS